MKRALNLRRDAPDARDRLLAPAPAKLPPSVDLRGRMPPVYDQGQLGSCTANAIGAAVQYHNQGYMPSRLFIYWNERVSDGDPAQDSGSTIRTGIKVTASLGACPEPVWPYDIAQFAVKPPPRAFNQAAPDLITQYLSVPDVPGVKFSLAGGDPVAIGIVVYPSFMSDAVAASGVVPMPGSTEKPEGGHAVLVVGYDDAKSALLVRNSWGAGWGQGGYFWLPYAYLDPARDLAFDFWCIQKVQAELTPPPSAAWWKRIFPWL